MKYLIFKNNQISIGSSLDASPDGNKLLCDILAPDAETFLDTLYTGGDSCLWLCEDNVLNLISILENTIVQDQFFKIPEQYADRLQEVAAQIIMDRRL